MPNIIDMTAENSRHVVRERTSSVQWIVINDCFSANTIVANGTSCHYSILEDGSIHKLADPATSVITVIGKTVKSGTTHRYWGICTDDNSVGIGVMYSMPTLIDGSIDWSGTKYLSTKCQNSLVWLIGKLSQELNVSVTRVVRQYDITGQTDPVAYVNNDQSGESWTWSMLTSTIEVNAKEAESSPTPSETSEETSPVSSPTPAYSGTLSEDVSTTTVDPRNIFVTEAAKHIGSEGHDWVKSVVNIGNSNWCAATMCAVAITVGYAGIIMPGDCFGAGRFGYLIVTQYGGQRIPGGPNSSPEIGDFIELFPGSAASAGLPEEYQSHHIGVVESVADTYVTTIEGNSENTYKRCTRSKASVSWYARPNWSAVGGVSSGYILPYVYTTSNTRADATLREVGYLSYQGEPSIVISDVALLTVNYTSLLAAFVGLLGKKSFTIDPVPQSPSDLSSVTERLTSVEREIFNYLASIGFNLGACCGIVGAMSVVTFCRTSYYNPYNKRSGLCAWSGSRKSSMQSSCGSAWKTNLTGQLQFMRSELFGEFSSVKDQLLSVEDSEAGAKRAASIFLRMYIIPDNEDELISDASSKASSLWNDTHTSAGSSVLSVVVPNILDGEYQDQSGVTTDYLNYAYRFSSFRSDARRVADIWAAQGRKSKYFVATIDDYYIVSMRSKFGKVGDRLRIELSDGQTIDCILGVLSTGSVSSPWGDVVSGGVSIIKWAAAGSETIWSCPALESTLKSWGVYGKTVKRVTNYGRYC